MDFLYICETEFLSRLIGPSGRQIFGMVYAKVGGFGGICGVIPALVYAKMRASPGFWRNSRPDLRQDAGFAGILVQFSL